MTDRHKRCDVETTALTNQETSLSRQLDAAESYMAQASATDLPDLCIKINKSRALLKAIRACRSIIAKAVILELKCLRRMHQVGAEAPKGTRWLIREAGEMSLDRFEKMCQWVDGEWAASTVLRKWTQDFSTNGVGSAALSRVSTGTPIAKYGHPVDSEDDDHGYIPPSVREHFLRETNDAVYTILDDLRMSGSFTVNEATDKLEEALFDGWFYQKKNHQEIKEVREGLMEVVRHALRKENHRKVLCDRNGRELPLPDFVTYLDTVDDGNHWVRVPWHSAGIQQLQFMASYRMQQAQDLLSSAQDLNDLYSAMAEMSDLCGSKNLGEIITFSISEGAYSEKDGDRPFTSREHVEVLNGR